MSDALCWQKSSYSGGNGPNCLEIACRDGFFLVRESDEPATVLIVGLSSLYALVHFVKGHSPCEG
ncbi:DUF397 domain-containing protein [Streptomyces sp. NPDC003077]|uniref:DUF397 domain-containing protein n=1 Tax=Streptomyces sp. NPDC003077 TaxID=3154443 RepID=UPI0033B1D711